MAPPAKDTLTSLLRSSRGSPIRRDDMRLFSSQPNTPSPGYHDSRHAAADFTEADEDEEDDVEDEDADDIDDEDDRPRRTTRFDLNEDRRGSSAGQLLPLFSESYLGICSAHGRLAWPNGC